MAKFKRAIIKETKFSGSKIKQIDFGSAEITDSDFSRTNLKDSRLDYRLKMLDSDWPKSKCLILIC